MKSLCVDGIAFSPEDRPGGCVLIKAKQRKKKNQQQRNRRKKLEVLTEGNRQMKKVISVALAAMMILMFCAACAEEAEDPVVIRVGDFSYSKSLVEFTMHTAADQSGVYWETLEPEEKEIIRDAVVEEVIGIGIIENKLTEKGMHDFTEAEEEILRARAQAQYDQAWQGLYRYATEKGIEVTEEQVSQWLDSMGYTLDMFRMSLEAVERQFRMFDLFCDPVNPTADEIDTFYLENFVIPDQAKYENNIALYEQDVYLSGNASFYTPEGYSLVKWVTVPYPDDVAEEARPFNIRFTLEEAEVMDAYNALGTAAATVEDFSDLIPYREAYDQAGEKMKAAEAELISALSKALPAAEAVKEKIERQMADGMTFDHAVRIYDETQAFADPDNPGTPFHPDSPNWTGNMYEAAASLTEPGQIAAPILTADGMYIFYYASDLAGGAHELTAEERDMVVQNAVYTGQLNQLKAMMETWKQEYEITADLTLLNME